MNKIAESAFFDELEKIALNRSMRQLFVKGVSDVTKKRIAETLLTPEKKQSLMSGISRGNEIMAKKYNVDIRRPKGFREAISMSSNPITAPTSGVFSAMGRFGAHSIGNQVFLPQQNRIGKVIGFLKDVPIVKEKYDPILLRHEIDERRFQTLPSKVFQQGQQHNSPRVIQQESLNSRAMAERDRSISAKIREPEINTINQIASGKKSVEVVSGTKKKVYGFVLGHLNNAIKSNGVLKKTISSAYDITTKGVPVTAQDRKHVAMMKDWVY